ncbi:MAG: flagellar basal-body MS-ring/collar protein FliF [Gammaproteobacteria bacterium]|nr:flagellar basal-body MS-ring/collar protein FliF [Gammaproteobacteria bacterium]
MELAKTQNTSPMGAFAEGFIQLPAIRQMGVLFGFAAVAALGVALVLWSWNPSYGVLFGNLGDKEAAEIADLLRQRNIEYKLDERTGALLVPSAKVQELRMQLAAEGLPRSSGAGLEILQQKSEFGTSQFMETTRYQHALEQELARTIISLSNVESARVHLALPKQSVFVRKRQAASASVLLKLYAGRLLEEEQVAAIRYLVASGIPNLEPTEVTVVDESGRLLSSRKRSGEMALNQDQFEYTSNVERNYIERIEDILAPIVGRHGMRAQVVAELDFTVTEQTHESFNPDLPALRSEQISEERMLGEALQGVPGALSNQPPGAASVPEVAAGTEAGGAEGQLSNGRMNATRNYELDRTISHSRFASGNIKRLSIAVVVDDRVTAEGQREPRSAEEMERLTSLVREAVGYNVARGDTVNVISTAFASPELVGELPQPPIWEETWVLDIAKVVGALLLGMLLIFMVLRPMMRNLSAVSARQPALAGAGAAPGMAEDQLSLTGGAKSGLIKLPGPGAYEDNIDMVKQVVKDDPKLVAQVVRNWISEDK